MDLSQREQIRIVIADDHPIVREGLRSLLKTQRGMRIVGEAADGRQAVEQVLLHRPDLLLLDLRMPGMSGVEVIRTIRSKLPDLKVIILSNYEGDQDIYRALRSGAKAYLLKTSPHKELLECIRVVSAGGRWVSPAAGGRLAAGLEQPSLTEREVGIICLMVKGKSNKEIGVELGISENTVKVHMGRIFKKLGASGRLEAIRIALERGITHLEHGGEV